MKTIILPYSELKDLPGYEDLDETSYNTLVEVVDKILPKAKKLNLQCRMKSYGGYENYTESQVTLHNECGTSACIVGVIATLFPVDSNYFLKFALVFSYAHFQLDKIPGLCTSKKGEMNMWNFLFSEDWPNSFELGVKRIKTVLSGDYIEGWDLDWHGENPLFNF